MHQKLTSRLRQFGAETDALERLAAMTEGAWSAAAGASIAVAREPSVHVHLLEEGWAHRSRWLNDHRRQTTALLLPGDICDLDALPLGGCDAHVLAFSPCRGVRLRAAALTSLLREEPSLASGFQRLAAADAVVTTEWLTSLGRRSAVERIAHLLCETAVRLGCALDRDPVTFNMPLTQTDVADATGLSVVHVNRSLQALRREGVRIKKRRVTLTSFEAVAEVASFDAGYLFPRAAPESSDAMSSARRHAMSFS